MLVQALSLFISHSKSISISIFQKISAWRWGQKLPFLWESENWIMSFESSVLSPQDKGRIVQHHGEYLSSWRWDQGWVKDEDCVAGTPTSLISFHSWLATKCPSFPQSLSIHPLLYLTRLLGMNSLTFPPTFLPPCYLHPPPIFTSLPFQQGAFLLWSDSGSIFSWLLKDHAPSNISLLTQLPSLQSRTVVRCSLAPKSPSAPKLPLTVIHSHSFSSQFSSLKK